MAKTRKRGRNPAKTVKPIKGKQSRFIACELKLDTKNAQAALQQFMTEQANEHGFAQIVHGLGSRLDDGLQARTDLARRISEMVSVSGDYRSAAALCVEVAAVVLAGARVTMAEKVAYCRFLSEQLLAIAVETPQSQGGAA